MSDLNEKLAAIVGEKQVFQGDDISVITGPGENLKIIMKDGVIFNSTP